MTGLFYLLDYINKKTDTLLENVLAVHPLAAFIGIPVITLGAVAVAAVLIFCAVSLIAVWL